MSELKATGAKERVDPMNTHGDDNSSSFTHGDKDRLVGNEPSTQPLLPNYRKHASNEVPRWLRPFFSMRVQLTFAYCLILMLMLAFAGVLEYRQLSSLYIILVIVGVVLAGSALAFLFTTVLLRPLWRITDAAQAIAIGDLEQRERLPFRLPPQDEIDRLAGSLNEMATRLEHTEEMQRASEERFRRFFSDASHQLRTPLTSIRGFTELLMRGAKDDPETSQRILKRMQNEAERMTKLINDLLTLARLDDRHPLKMQYTDLVELAVQSIEQTRARANDERQISLIIDTEEQLGLQADKERLKQVLFILLDNALKYGRAAPDGSIVLKLDKQRGQTFIIVIDNGEGISKDDLEHIFEEFYRGRRRSPASGTQSAGAGLGLTIASAIVRAHNGTITVCSDVGKGTEFKVTLPGIN